MGYQRDPNTTPSPLPTDYDRQHSFTDFQKLNPTDPIPGSQLDNEFNAVERALDETQSRLRLIQRDDGAVQNRSIGLDQLKNEAKTGVNAPVEWTPETGFSVNDSVILGDGEWYLAAESHTSGLTFQGDLTAGRWRELLNLAPYTAEAKNWATWAEDELVPEGNGVDEYSAQHHAAKAMAAQIAAELARDGSVNAKNAAQTAQSASETARDQSQAARDAAQLSESNAKDSENTSLEYRDDAQLWASNPEGLAVEPGKFSALHHAAKSEQSAVNAASSATASAQSRDAASDSAGAAQASASAAQTAELRSKDARDESVALYGGLAEVNQAVTDSQDAASSAAGSAAAASDSESSALADANRAESARDAAQLNAGVYDNTARGLSNTLDGQYFSTPSSDIEAYLVLYRNDAGTATEIAEYPSIEAGGRRRLRERLLAEATLSLDFANNRYSVFEGIGNGQTLVPYETALTHTRGSDATGYGVGKLETVGVDTKRLVRDPESGKSQGLLVEEQRTNLLLWSEDFTNGVWGKVEVAVEPGVVAAPDGTLSGARLYKTNAENYKAIRQSVTVAVGDYVPSIYVKKDSTSKVSFGFFDNGTADTLARAVYDFDTDTFNNAETTEVKRELLRDGWVRLYVPGVSVVNGNVSLYIYPGVYSQQLISDDVYIWGAQLEAGSQPSSYIPTTTAQVTRQADQVSRVLGSEFNASEGTVFVEFQFPTYAEFSNPISLNEGGISSSGPRFLVRTDGDSVYMDGASFLSTPLNNLATGFFAGDKVKAAISFNKQSLTAQSVVNGGYVVSETISNASAVFDTLMIGQQRTSSPKHLNSTVLDAHYYPRALTEAELIALTTPET